MSKTFTKTKSFLSTLSICIFLSVFLTTEIRAEEKKEEPKFKLEFHGFVNYEMSYDTRQVVAGREGNIMLFPAQEILDDDGNDINDNPSLTYYALTSRLWTSIHGPDILGAKSYAHVEGDFMGTAPDKYNHIRLRHAFIRLDWEKAQIIAGQYWHPMFVTSCFPGVITFGASVPYHVLSRAPQLRFTYTHDNISLSGTMMTHSDFPTTGPNGPGSEYLRNSNIPEVFFQTIYTGEVLTTGASIGYMLLQPRLETTAYTTNDTLTFRTNETMGSLMGNLFFKLDFPTISIKAQGIYGENMRHLVMLGGYGETDFIDDNRQIRGYTGIHTMSLWTDIETKGEKLRFGLFGGYSENLGSEKEITGEHWGRGTNIAHIYRVAPRVRLIYDNLSFNFEIIYDVAAYGTPDADFSFDQTNEVSNIRTMVSMKYDF